MARSSLPARYAALLTVTVLLGAAIRFAALGLPHGMTKYGGSALWAAAIFWLVSLLAPVEPPARRAILAVVIAAVVELFKLVHTPALAHFRHTLAGQLLLGRYFSVRDLAAYVLGIGGAAALDSLVIRRRAVG